MSNVIEGTVVQVLPLQSGTSKTSGKEWKSQEFIVQAPDQYAKPVCFSLFGDKIDVFIGLVKVNQQVKVWFDVESSEFNGRWFTKCRAYKIEDANAAPIPQAPAAGYGAGYAAGGNPSVPQGSPAFQPNTVTEPPF